jgi:hypothetical protein
MTVRLVSGNQTGATPATTRRRRERAADVADQQRLQRLAPVLAKIVRLQTLSPGAIDIMEDILDGILSELEP